jgi:hypothetical protein
MDNDLKSTELIFQSDRGVFGSEVPRKSWGGILAHFDKNTVRVSIIKRTTVAGDDRRSMISDH